MYTSSEFNSNWIVRLDWEEIHTLIGYANLCTILGPAQEKTFTRLRKFKGEKLIIRPFHGMVVTFYVR